MTGRTVALSATDPLGHRVVCYESTLAAHREKHTEPFSDADIIDCIEAPDIIAKTGHEIAGHKARLVYYKDREDFDDPRTMKTIVEHKGSPGVVTSMFRTSKRTNDGPVQYISPDCLERLRRPR